MTLGYVGLGNMGGALARRLHSQHNVHRMDMLVHDADPAATARAGAAGLRTADSLAEVAARCDTLMLCLPTSSEVRTAIFGPGGLASAARPGTLLVDQTTGDPIATRAMAAELAHSGVELIDAPVSGGLRGAENGTIAIMVGASDGQYARIEPVLKAISPNVFHAGGVGCGDVMKLANNMMSAAGRLVGLEAMALAVKNGIEPHRAADIFLASSGSNFWMQHFIRKVIDGDIVSNFTLGLSYKDVRLATQLGVDSEVPMFFGNLVREFYAMCINEVGREAQVNSAALVMEKIAGTTIVAKPAEDLASFPGE